MDFNAWNDLAAASEEEVLQRQRSDFETQSQAATQALLRAQRDAQKTREFETRGNGGQGVATTTLSSVGSYGDYLKAKQNAQNAAMRLAGGNAGELGDVRRRANADGGYNANAIEATARLGAREQYVGGQDAASLVGVNQGAEARRGREKAAAEAKAAREAADAEALKNFQTSLGREKGKWDNWQAGQSQVGMMDRQRIAQMELAQFQRDPSGFNPFDKNGRQLRSAAYGGSQEGQANPFNPWGYTDKSKQQSNFLTEDEKKWGSYGGQK